MPRLQLFSRLILLYFSPTTEEQEYLRQCLSVFFPAYAFSARSHQEDIQSAMLPSLRAVMLAPTDSPVHQIKPQDLADMFMFLTGTVWRS